MASPQEVAAQMLARCNGGFDNHFEWQNWAKKHRKEVDALPIPLRRQVWASWNNASTPEFSKPVRQ